MEARDRPDEIEITPEMIEAGTEALAFSDDNLDVAVWAVFKAMVLASPKLRSFLVREP
jgi:phage terminase large subunit-like protein